LKTPFLDELPFVAGPGKDNLKGKQPVRHPARAARLEPHPFPRLQSIRPIEPGGEGPLCFAPAGKNRPCENFMGLRAPPIRPRPML